VDPNDAMESFARSNLAKANAAFGGGGGEDASLRIVHGVAEALPLKDNSADAVVCTLTLCSVLDQVAAVSEIKRILKPGAPFMFIEHVLSEDDPRLAAQQISLNGMQVAMADGCHLDRKTLDVIDAAGFASVRSERFTLPGFGLISSQVAGIAIV
jgi:ubiquinone/menaquinone biosynthesis C-methylase UbiE